ncbi:peptidase C14 [Microthyrium microscopicum]|uniref:Peptidase C14 n=1 Tax=Microthyrium microscopicum TaxID=703497 RepID=A0A6A6UV45_9PEZI|nr:peptidase C14 [Microthyrium microscopicum]
MSGRKALLIGINYVGTKNELRGCHSDARNVLNFLQRWGYDPSDCVLLSDEPNVQPGSRSWPSGQNILRAMDWLVRGSEGQSLFFHYSGHGGQVQDSDGSGGLTDTICPVDFQENGQMDSDTLHRHLVSPLPQGASLHAIFDCCHSGTVMELPYTYRTDADGNVNLVDNIKQGIQLAESAAHLMQGGFSMNSVRDAEQLFAGARSFWKGLQHMGGEGGGEEGLAHGEHGQEYYGEVKQVIMYSGCRDDQTSADASIAGAATGAMSWAFLQVMAQFNGQQSYVEILQNTRGMLQQKYSQVPQLSCGEQMDLNRPFRI